MGRLVYDSEAGRLCPGCSQPVDACRCRKQHAVPEGDGVVRIRFMGACIGCPSSSMTLKMGIENNLKQHVPEVTGVEAVDPV